MFSRNCGDQPLPRFSTVNYMLYTVMVCESRGFPFLLFMFDSDPTDM